MVKWAHSLNWEYWRNRNKTSRANISLCSMSSHDSSLKVNSNPQDFYLGRMSYIYRGKVSEIDASGNRLQFSEASARRVTKQEKSSVVQHIISTMLLLWRYSWSRLDLHSYLRDDERPARPRLGSARGLSSSPSMWKSSSSWVTTERVVKIGG